MGVHDKHASCMHDAIKYCRHCDTAYCTKCDVEWTRGFKWTVNQTLPARTDRTWPAPMSPYWLTSSPNQCAAGGSLSVDASTRTMPGVNDIPSALTCAHHEAKREPSPKEAG